MATAETTDEISSLAATAAATAPAPAPAPAPAAAAAAAATLPDYLTSPNAVFKDEGVQWRYGRAPDYSKTRKVWEEGKRMSHAPGSLEEIIENLVKNWEVEASFKPRLADWRTIDHEKYSFAMGGGPTLSAEDMIRVGTYNGIIAPNEYYSPENSDFASSHKTFKRMMPTFAWEVLEVYSGPPRVSFRWRHWGTMKNDYVGFNDKGEKVTAKAHGGQIDMEGVTVAKVDERLRLQDLQTWMDPLEMFRQIAPKGIVNKEVVTWNVEREVALDTSTDRVMEAREGMGGVGAKNRVDGGVDTENGAQKEDVAKKVVNGDAEKEGQVESPEQEEEQVAKHVSESTVQPADVFVPHQGTSRNASPEEVGTTETATEPEQQTTEQQAIIQTAATRGAEAPIYEPLSNHDEAVQNSSTDEPLVIVKTQEPLPNDSSIFSSIVTRNEDAVIEKKPTDDDDSLRDAVDEYWERPADEVHPHPKDMEKDVLPAAGEAVAAAPQSEETRVTHEEMGSFSPSECPFLMNRE